jgi:hypothetical protein
MITDAKISSAAKISPAKIAPAQVGQLMVAQADGKYAPVTISGDANLALDGKLRLKNLDEITERALAKAGEYFNRNEETLKRSDLKKGKTLVGGATTPVEVPVGTGASAIPQRDSSGNLNADKLDNKASDFYTNADNQTAGTSTTATVGTLTTVTQNHPSAKVVATISGTDGSGPNPASSATIPHNLGFLPSVSVVTVDGSTITPIEVEVANGVNLTTITLTQTIGSLVGNPDLEVRLG